MTHLVAIMQVLGWTAQKVVLLAASKSTPPGLRTALAHVPVWTHAHQVLENRMSVYAGSGAIGAFGVGLALKKLALKKAMLGNTSS
ncbi:MAG: hypothetical protein QW514_08150 [Thermoprotei archaeon]